MIEIINYESYYFSFSYTENGELLLVSNYDGKIVKISGNKDIVGKIKKAESKEANRLRNKIYRDNKMKEIVKY